MAKDTFFYILVLLVGSNSIILLIAYLLSSIIIFISQYLFLNFPNHNKNSIFENLDYKREIVNYSLPFSYFGLFTFAHISSDRLSLQFFSSTENVGLYSVLFQIGYYPILIFTNFLSQLISPALFQMANRSDSEDGLRAVSKFIFWLTSAVVFVTFLLVLFSYCFHSHIFILFVSKDYSRISYLLPWAFLGAGLFCATQMLSSIFMTHFKSYLLIRLKIFTSVLGILFNIAGAYYYGILGIVISSIAFSVIYFIYSIFLISSKKFGLK